MHHFSLIKLLILLIVFLHGSALADTKKEVKVYVKTISQNFEWFYTRPEIRQEIVSAYQAIERMADSTDNEKVALYAQKQKRKVDRRYPQIRQAVRCGSLGGSVRNGEELQCAVGIVAERLNRAYFRYMQENVLNYQDGQRVEGSIEFNLEVSPDGSVEAEVLASSLPDDLSTIALAYISFSPFLKRDVEPWHVQYTFNFYENVVASSEDFSGDSFESIPETERKAIMGGLLHDLKADKLDPDMRAEYHYTLARLYSIGGNKAEIYAQLESTEELGSSPFYLESMFRLAEIDFSEYRNDKAFERYSEVCRSSEQGSLIHIQACYKLGWVEFKAQHYVEAIDASLTLQNLKSEEPILSSIKRDAFRLIALSIKNLCLMGKNSTGKAAALLNDPQWTMYEGEIREALMRSGSIEGPLSECLDALWRRQQMGAGG